MIGFPVFWREVRLGLRRWRSALWAALYLAALAAVLGWIWPEQGVYSLAAQSSRSLVAIFASALLLATLLLAPAFSAVAIVSEKEGRTYDLLFHTLLRPHELALGKMLSSLALLAIYLGLSFPFFAATFLLGAVSVAETALLYGVTAATAAGAALLGLAISSVARDSHTAILRTYSALLFWLAAPWAVAAILGGRPDLAEAAYRLRAVSPLAALLSVLRPPAAAATLPPVWQLFLEMTAIGGAALLLFLVAQFLRRPSEPRRVERVIDDRRELARRRYRFPFYLVDPQRRKRLLPGWINPVFAREMRARAMGGGVWLVRGLYLCFGVSAVLVILLAGQVVAYSPDGLKGIAVAFQIGLVALIGPALTAGAITREIEGGLFDPLRMTRLGPFALFAGKLEVALLFVLLLLVGAAPLWAVIYVMELNTLREIYIAGALILATMLFALAAGFFGSTYARHSSAAAALAYALVFALVAATLAPFLAPARFAPAVRRAFEQANPFLVAWSVLRTETAERLDWALHLRRSLAASALLGVLSYVRLRFRFAPDR
jgi:ABC-type transport system involved in multi-copper enzyme maturation permease subunit